MKTILNKIQIFILLAGLALMLMPGQQLSAQEKKSLALDQNISIFAEEEPLADVIEKICKYLGIDYSYNAEGNPEKYEITLWPIIPSFGVRVEF